jgi:hypothetical protein
VPLRLFGFRPEGRGERGGGGYVRRTRLSRFVTSSSPHVRVGKHASARVSARTGYLAPGSVAANAAAGWGRPKRYPWR